MLPPSHLLLLLLCTAFVLLAHPYTGPLSVAADVRIPATPNDVSAQPSPSGAVILFTVPQPDDFDEAGFGSRRYIISLATGTAAAWRDVTVAHPPVYVTADWGLAAGSDYSFAVAPANGLGETGSMATSNSITVGAPQAVAEVTGTAQPNAVRVSWTAAVDNGSPVTSYTITVTPDDGSSVAPVSVTGSPPATTVVVESLANQVGYSFAVTATNAVGTSPPTTTPSVTRPQGTHTATKNSSTPP